MMDWWKLIPALLAGYLLGSVSVAVVLTKRLSKGDIRKQGSGNAGATNVARVYGIWVGLATLAGDGLKTALAMYLGSLIAGEPGMIAAAFGCLMGHCFPLYFGFKGGKAVSVSAAIGLFLDWRFFLILVAVFFLTFFLTKRVSVCSMAAAVAYPLGMLALGGFPWYALALGCFITVFVIFMHRENLKRLIKGTEPKFTLGNRK
jgi:glycerol-3-phosphate acyltransferase PlsY